jgi:NADPH-dependent ferric siderophore reductase
MRSHRIGPHFIRIVLIGIAMILCRSKWLQARHPRLWLVARRVAGDNMRA